MPKVSHRVLQHILFRIYWEAVILMGTGFGGDVCWT